jgi:hypothetical protein
MGLPTYLGQEAVSALETADPQGHHIEIDKKTH